MQKRTDVSQIFDIFAPQNCDQKVTKSCSEKNLLVGKKKSPPVGQTLGSSHFEETPLSFGGDFAVYKFHRLQNVFKILFHKKVCKIICAKRKKTKFKILFFSDGSFFLKLNWWHKMIFLDK